MCVLLLTTPVTIQAHEATRGGLSSLFTALWVSLPVRLLFSLQHHWGTADKNYYTRLQLLLTVVDRPGVAQGNIRARLTEGGKAFEINGILEKT